MWYVKPVEPQSILHSGGYKTSNIVRKMWLHRSFKKEDQKVPYFSSRSDEKLATCRDELQQVCRTVIQQYDFSVIWGHRSEIEQNSIAEIFSAKKYPNSKHNLIPSLAVDIAPYPIDWSDVNRFILLAGMMLMSGYLLGIKLRWGGDWNGDMNMKDQTLMDWGHFELVQGKERD